MEPEAIQDEIAKETQGKIEFETRTLPVLKKEQPTFEYYLLVSPNGVDFDLTTYEDYLDAKEDKKVGDIIYRILIDPADFA